MMTSRRRPIAPAREWNVRPVKPTTVSWIEFDAARGTALGLAREAGEAAASFRQRVEQALSDAVDKVQSFAAGAGDKAEQLAAQGRSVARDVYDYGRSTTADMRRRAGSMAGQARSMSSRTVDYMQDQPLLLGALGVTVGAAIGLLVPASRQERRVVGAMRENLMESAREAVGEAGQRAYPRGAVRHRHGAGGGAS